MICILLQVQYTIIYGKIIDAELDVLLLLLLYSNSTHYDMGFTPGPWYVLIITLPYYAYNLVGHWYNQGSTIPC